MFEQEAKEYTKENICKECHHHCIEGMCTCTECKKKTFKDGAEFGYNKANGWHDLRKDQTDLPKDNDEKLCFYGKGKVVARYDSEYGCWETEFNNLVTTFSSSILIAWKEIIPPELKEVDK